MEKEDNFERIKRAVDTPPEEIESLMDEISRNHKPVGKLTIKMIDNLNNMENLTAKTHLRALKLRNLQILIEHKDGGSMMMDEILESYHQAKIERIVEKIEGILKPEYSNTVFTWGQIKRALESK